MRNYFNQSLRGLGIVCAVAAANVAFAQRFIIGNTAKDSKYKIDMIVENANFSYSVDPGIGSWVYRWTMKDTKELGDPLYGNKFMIIDVGKEHVRDLEGDNPKVEKMTVKITDLDRKTETFMFIVKHNDAGGIETSIETKAESKLIETVGNTIMLRGVTFSQPTH